MASIANGQYIELKINLLERKLKYAQFYKGGGGGIFL
jgi:hypothetical protein